MKVNPKKSIILIVCVSLFLTLLVFMPKPVTATTAQWLEIKKVADRSQLTQSSFTVKDIFQPFLMELPNGTLRCTVEARGSGGDAGKVDIYQMLSYDGGGTWTAPRLFDTYLHYPYQSTYADYYLWEGTRLWRCVNSQQYSGGVWSDIQYVDYADSNYCDYNAYTGRIVVFDWTDPARYFGSTYFYVTNPGILTSKGYKIFPCQDLLSPNCRASLMYCKSGGTSASDWEAVHMMTTPTNENSIVETVNGDLYDVSRNQNVMLSDVWNYGGELLSWTNQGVAVPSPTQATKSFMTRYTTTDWEKNRLVLAYNRNNVGRFRMCVAVSYDEGENWQYSRIFDNDHEGDNTWQRMYPHILVTSNKTVMVAYSAGDGSVDWYTTIRIARMNVEWISNGADTMVYTGETLNDDIQFVSIDSGANGTNIYTSTPVIIWDASEKAGYYRLEISTSPTFSTLFADINKINKYTYPLNCVVTRTTITFTLPNIYSIPRGTYYFRVIEYK